MSLLALSHVPRELTQVEETSVPQTSKMSDMSRDAALEHGH